MISSDQKDLLDLLVKTLENNNLSEIEVEIHNAKIKLVKGAQKTISVEGSFEKSSSTEQISAPEEKKDAVLSPMVGVIYLKPDPDSKTFVNKGDKVSEGDSLALIEAMKVFNTLKAPRSGTITEILVQDGSPVEFGQALFVIE